MCVCVPGGGARLEVVHVLALGGLALVLLDALGAGDLLELGQHVVHHVDGHLPPRSVRRCVRVVRGRLIPQSAKRGVGGGGVDGLLPLRHAGVSGEMNSRGVRDLEIFDQLIHSLNIFIHQLCR
jgi:hypothetical protein